MAEYIEREALIKHLQKDPLFRLVERYGITRVIESFPAADVAPVQRWVPVTERLPEDFKAVLVYTPKYLNQFMAYRKDDGWRVWSPQDNHGVPFINGQGEITHWMPLPEKPKERTISHRWHGCDPDLQYEDYVK